MFKLKTSLIRQIRVMTPVTLFSLVISVHYPWTTANKDHFHSSEQQFPLSSVEFSMVTSLLFFGRFLVALIKVFIPLDCGRRIHFIVGSWLMLIGTGMLFCPETFWFLAVARFIIGLGVGVADMAINMYIGETVSKKVRGAFISVTIVVFCIGIMFSFAAAALVEYKYILCATTVVTILLSLSTFDLVESPYFLTTNGRSEKALATLKWLNNYNQEEAEDELKILSDNIEKSMNFLDLIRNFHKPEMYKSILVVVVMGITLTLLSAVTTTFANMIFPTTNTISSYLLAMGFLGLVALASFGSTLVVDKFGRRPLLLWGLSIQTIAQMSIAVLYVLHDHYKVEIPHFTWLMFVFITIVFLLLQFSCAVPYGVVRGEIFPTSFKNIAVGTNVTLNSVSNFIFSSLFVPIHSKFGLGVLFLIFSVSSFITLLVVAVCLPETKGKSLIEIQKTLQKK